MRSTEVSAVRAMFRLGPYNTITAALLLVAGFTHGTVDWVLWSAAFVLHWTSPAITAVGGFRIKAAHFVERHGLIVLIALGESVVAVGIGVPGRDLTAGLAVKATLGLALAAALWWMYFDGEDERAEQALRNASDERNPWLALFAFGYAFLPVLAGIVLLAAGVKRAIVSYNQPADAATAWFLAAGVALYAMGLVSLRFVLHTGSLVMRAALAFVALVTVLVGLRWSPEWQITALTALATLAIVVERDPAVISRSDDPG
jgi:low temperature requirement protein LtrA